MKKRRKPLLLQGARQVGKTYILKEFGKNEFPDIAYFNFEENSDLSMLFDKSLDASHLIESLSLYREKKISPGSTLIIFDEIQAAPRAITSLKYFCENAEEYFVAGAGSLLGVSVGKESSFPVGKVNFLHLNPLTFTEYLYASNNSLLAQHLTKKSDCGPLQEPLHEKLLGLFRLYLYLGGMPEVVANYVADKDIAMAREIQNDILKAYSRDFSKYSTSSEAIRISALWSSIPSQLSRARKKFRYKDISKTGRAAKYESAIEWLNKAGLVHLSYNIKNPKIPLSGYFDNSKFKVYLLDTGLLGAMLEVSSKIIIEGDKLFSEYNGAFIENYVAAELKATSNNKLCYWTSKSEAEVDFILGVEQGIIPLEVKSGYSRSKKSLQVYKEKYNPSCLVRLSPRNFTKDDDFYNIPLYGVNTLTNFFPLPEPGKRPA